jgi:hypothetical protein
MFGTKLSIFCSPHPNGIFINFDRFGILGPNISPIDKTFYLYFAYFFFCTNIFSVIKCDVTDLRLRSQRNQNQKRSALEYLH